MTYLANILTDDVVEDAVISTLKKWVGTELNTIEHQLGLTPGHYGRPKSYEVHTDFESFPEEQMPRIVVVSLGFADEPAKRANGAYTHYLQVGIAAIASSTDQIKSRRYAYRLAGAVAAALVHHQSMDQGIGGRVQGVDLTDRRNGEIPPDGDRTLWMVRQMFRIEVADALTKNGGMATPIIPQDPGVGPLPGDWPAVEPPDPGDSGIIIDHAED